MNKVPEHLIRTDSDRKAIKEGCCYYNQSRTDKVVTFLENYCVMSKSPWNGKALKLLPWQKDFISSVFGFLRPDGTRRHRYAGVWIPKKNGRLSPLV